MPQVTARTDDGTSRTTDCREGATLLEALSTLGVRLETPCNGRGTCGKCKVGAHTAGGGPDLPDAPDPLGPLGPLDPQEARLLSAEEVAAGVRLACLARVGDDVTVEVPRLRAERDALTRGRGGLPFAPDRTNTGVGAAVDLGTTTVACSLVRLADGVALASASCLNGQARFGADVFTRISHEIDGGETDGGETARLEMQGAAVRSVGEVIDDACRKAGIDPAEVREVAVAANCTMTHMLLGADARPLGRAPYRPAFTQARIVPAASLGIEVAPDASLYCLPQASAFIGGDIVAGALVCGMGSLPGSTLFVDIGTNGELVLAYGDRLLCTSCAVGPALEGMNISCGMRAEEGAVEDARFDNGSLQLTVIGDAPPVGLCGSGVLALTRELVAHGIIEARGTIARPEAFDENDPRRSLIRVDENGKRRLVFGPYGNLALTQTDVRQVQTAKAALLSGVLTLLDAAGLRPDEVDRVLVAGQFGAHLPASSLMGTGLLPQEFAERIEYVGNTSLIGATATLVSSRTRKVAEELAARMGYVDLSCTPGYERLFAKCTRFEARQP